ncbi:MAG: haloalkane dehalogenase [Bacteroidota bacterium]
MPSAHTPSAAFPFASNYLEVKGSKLHYIDEGEGEPILFLHGNPTSSYLWRNIIPYLSDQARCIAPDLIGMGKSGKPDLAYGFADTYAYLLEFIQQLDLKDLTLVIHDWGSGLGFHYAHQHPDNIKGIAFMEAMYKLVNFSAMPARVRIAMPIMRTHPFNWLMLGAGNLFLKAMLPQGIQRSLLPEEKTIYQAPYPTIKSRKPVRVWPQEIPINGKPAHTHAVVSGYHQWLKETPIPKLCLYASPGMLIPEEEIPWIAEHFPNTTTVHVGEGLHFLQEDQPQAIGEALREWWGTLGA